MFGLAVVGYLFLGGVGGGLALVGGAAGLAVLRSGRFRDAGRLLGATFGAAAVALVAGALLLLADAGNYAALPGLFFPPKPSLLSLGAWAIALAAALAFGLCAFWGGGVACRCPALAGVAQGIAALAGLAVALYTGLFLASMRAVPFWHTPLVPVLFVLSSASCGLVLFAVFAKGLGVRGAAARAVRCAVRLDAALVAAEALCAAALVALALWFSGTGSAAVAAASARAVVAGPGAWLWWAAFFGAGIAAVLAFDIALLRDDGRGSGRAWATVAPAFSVLAGALALRYCIVSAGMHPALAF